MLPEFARKVISCSQDEKDCFEAISCLESSALKGDASSAGVLGEFFATGGMQNSPRSYYWYVVHFSLLGEYTDANNEHDDPDRYYVGPEGDFRNEGIVNDLIVEIGVALVAEIEARVRQDLRLVK